MEHIPDAAVIDGVPRGLFLGRSLLTGRAVCLLFLSGGRVTRFIPTGGLENFDWAQHRASHFSDSGTWEWTGGQLRIAWGDGGANHGQLTGHSDSIEFYGKRYARPTSVSVAALAGHWQSARGMAVVGGEGINTTSTLIVEAGGRYRWCRMTGGAVAGRAAADSDVTGAGTLSITGSTATFRADDGTVVSHTFLPVSGTPLAAFSLDAAMFTRAE